MDLRAVTEARASEFAPMDLQAARDKLDRPSGRWLPRKCEEAHRLTVVAQLKAKLAEANR